MPPTPVTFTCTSSPVEARESIAPLLSRQPIWLSITANNIEALIADPRRCANPRWWVGHDADGEVVAAFMHTPPHPLHVAFATVQQAGDLADVLVTEPDSLIGVGGMRLPAEAFGTAWSEGSGSVVTTWMELGVYDLPCRPTVPFEVAGRFRRATLGDLALTDRWAGDFHDAVEATGSAPSTRRHLEAGRVGLWEDESGTPVSMAYASVPGAGVTRVSGVWTPPEQRGNGYASAVVAALSNERMDAAETCMLYTDLANPTSNGIYQALGYRRIGDSISLAFH